MKNGTLYAGRLKKVLPKVRREAGAQEVPAAVDAMHSLGVAVLGRECGDAAAERAMKRALSTMVDWNEIRVSSASELNKAIGNSIPHGLQRCQDLITALQCVFDRENCLSLERLAGLGRREARQFLEQLDGVDEYAAAYVFLWSLGGHAIPVNDILLAELRDADLVNPSASRDEVQAFLERHVSAAEGKEFCLLMRSFRAPKRAAASKTAKAAAKKKTASK